MKSLEKIKELEQKKQFAFDDLKNEVLATLDANYIESICKALDDSRDLTWVENDELLHVWVRVDLKRLTNADLSNSYTLSALREVLQDHDCLELDFKNSCITRSIGPCIVINEDGSVYDEELNKWIFQNDDYESIDQRDTAIEKHMEQNGVFPSVVKADQYNNYFFYNTQRRT